MRPILLSFTLFLFAGTQPAFAQTMQCGPRDMVLNMLATGTAFEAVETLVPMKGVVL